MYRRTNSPTAVHIITSACALPCVSSHQQAHCRKYRRTGRHTAVRNVAPAGTLSCALLHRQAHYHVYSRTGKCTIMCHVIQAGTLPCVLSHWRAHCRAYRRTDRRTAVRTVAPSRACHVCCYVFNHFYFQVWWQHHRLRHSQGIPPFCAVVSHRDATSACHSTMGDPAVLENSPFGFARVS